MPGNLEQQSQEQREKTQIYIWAIDDNPEVQIGFSQLFETEGFKFKMFGSGEEALNALDGEEAPDVFILDGDLGQDQMSGPQIVIKLGEKGINSSIVAHSSKVEENDLMEKNAKKFGIRVKKVEKGVSGQRLSEIIDAVKSFGS